MRKFQGSQKAWLGILLPPPPPSTHSGPRGSEDTTDWLEEGLPFKELLIPSPSISHLPSPYWEEMDGREVGINISLDMGK